MYQCDDKCGSQWLKAPVAKDGRDNKANAQSNFRFALQSNMVVGKGGCSRFMVVAKHIQTGGNFGLTCLIKGLHRCRMLILLYSLRQKT